MGFALTENSLCSSDGMSESRFGPEGTLCMGSFDGDFRVSILRPGSEPRAMYAHPTPGVAIKFSLSAVDKAGVVPTSDKWFKRNCNDVLGRQCTPAERADVLAYLLSL